MTAKLLKIFTFGRASFPVLCLECNYCTRAFMRFICVHMFSAWLTRIRFLPFLPFFHLLPPQQWSHWSAASSGPGCLVNRTTSGLVPLPHQSTSLQYPFKQHSLGALTCSRYCGNTHTQTQLGFFPSEDCAPLPRLRQSRVDVTNHDRPAPFPQLASSTFSPPSEVCGAKDKPLTVWLNERQYHLYNTAASHSLNIIIIIIQ